MQEEIREEPQEIIYKNSSSSSRARLTTWLMVVFMTTTVICAVGWYHAYNPMAENGIYKNYTGAWDKSGTVYSERWNINGNRASVWLDLNYDFNFEKLSYYNISDQLVGEEIDDNEDGIAERSLRYSPEGKVRYEYLDEDANGWYERMLSYGKQITVEYRDSDFDCEYDSIYVYEDNVMINSLSVFEMGQFFRQAKRSSQDSISFQK